MTVTNRQIATAHAALNALFNMKLPDGSSQYPLIRFAQKYNPVADAYIAAERAISEKFVAFDEDAGAFRFENGRPVMKEGMARADYDAELKRLQDMDADIQFKPLPWSIFKDVEIEPVILLAIDWALETPADDQ